MRSYWALLVISLTWQNLYAVMPENLDLVQKEPETITSIESESSNNLTLIHIYLKQKLNEDISSIENMGDYLQLTIPRTKVPEPGKFYESSAPLVQKISAFQSKNGDAILRIFLTTPIDDLSKNVEVQTLDDRISVVLHRPANISAFSTVNKPTKQTSDDPLNINSYLSKFAFYSGILILGLVFFLSIRRTRLMRGSKKTNEISMEIISKLQVNQRQSLLLLQVLNEKLLISVAHDQVHLISKFPTKSENSIHIENDLNTPVYTKAPALQQTLQYPQINSSQTERDNTSHSSQTREKFLLQLKETIKKKSDAKHAAEDKAPKNQENKSINYAIGDEGITNRNSNLTNQNPKAINDVAKLIRDKLKFVPKTG